MWRIIISLWAIYWSGCQPGSKELPMLGPENHVVPAFSLVNQNGDTSGSEILSGKIFVADFFFTRCPSICPRMTSEMKRVQDRFAGVDDLKLVSFTVDPERDSSETLAAYMDQFGADPAMWTMYTGDKKDLYRLARSGFYITAVEGDGGEEDFIHSEKLVLVDRQGRIRGYYNGIDSTSVNQLIADIRKLLPAAK